MQGRSYLWRKGLSRWLVDDRVVTNSRWNDNKPVTGLYAFIMQVAAHKDRTLEFQDEGFARSFSPGISSTICSNFDFKSVCEGASHQTSGTLQTQH